MTDLELILRETAATLEWPPTPDVVDAVRARIRAEAGPMRSRRRRGYRLRRPLVIALAALLVLAGGAAAVPAIRNPVLDFLGLRSVTIERVPRLPAHAQPARTALGVPTTLAAARGKLGFAAVAAAGLGKPRVYGDTAPPGGRLVLSYRGGRLILTEFLGRLERPFLQKMLGPGTAVERVRVSGERGLWISGDLHDVVFLDSHGQIDEDQVHLAGNTLLWRRGRLLLRLEGARSQHEALRIARSVRAAP